MILRQNRQIWFYAKIDKYDYTQKLKKHDFTQKE